MSFDYRRGVRHGVLMPIDSSSGDITVGDAITTTGATAGYIQKVDGLADVVQGFAMQTVASPSADGEASVLVDVSKDAVYEVGPDAGSVTQALDLTSLDVGANAQSVDINGTTTADLKVVQVDVAANTIYVHRA